MQAVETFFTTAAIALFALGLVHCVLPRSFRLGVVLMLWGDACFAVAIAFPKKALAMLASCGVVPPASDFTVVGLIFALVITLICYLIFMRYFHYRPLWQKKTPVPEAPKSSSNTADPQLFKDVKLQSKAQNK
ncbi:MAG: hypothetical protein IAA31_07075 [Candidatus Anaerobiospirillum merdipullorum]|uniref:Uncharacterized protein n=1 Tax=Candidatus Anaerobiospirillum merdipullorum TaxID=2838450 RepID=A0A9E2KPN2_9GAMM|nr:hypothetical protein [Candidatus Anaerobiospirillum merdipullorum]